MIKNVYAIRDARVGFMTPIIEENDACAMRGFENAVLARDGYFANFASDYDLYRLGSFDSDSGQFDNELPVLLVSGASILTKREVSHETV